MSQACNLSYFQLNANGTLDIKASACWEHNAV